MVSRSCLCRCSCLDMFICNGFLIRTYHLYRLDTKFHRYTSSMAACKVHTNLLSHSRRYTKDIMMYNKSYSGKHRELN